VRASPYTPTWLFPLLLAAIKFGRGPESRIVPLGTFGETVATGFLWGPIVAHNAGALKGSLGAGENEIILRETAFFGRVARYPKLRVLEPAFDNVVDVRDASAIEDLYEEVLDLGDDKVRGVPILAASGMFGFTRIYVSCPEGQSHGKYAVCVPLEKASAIVTIFVGPGAVLLSSRVRNFVCSGAEQT